MSTHDEATEVRTDQEPDALAYYGSQLMVARHVKRAVGWLSGCPTLRLGSNVMAPPHLDKAE